MPIPAWLDYRLDASAAAVMLRNLDGNRDDWGALVADAQVLMAEYQGSSPTIDEEANLPLIAASRVLDSAGRSPDVEPSDRQALNLTAAACYGMYGNQTSAMAVARRLLAQKLNGDSSQAVVLALSAPSLLESFVSQTAPDSPERRFISSLRRFLETGEHEVASQLTDQLVACLANASSSLDGALLGYSLRTLEYVKLLSVARVLADEVDVVLPSTYVRQLIQSGVRTFLPPQHRALTQSRLIDRTDNALVALPTSTGKTLLGELCVMGSLGNAPGLACYVAPYIALARQVAQTFRRHLPAEVNVSRFMGGTYEDEPLNPSERMEVVIATPERLDALLRGTPELAEHLRCVVCDEAHMVESEGRGIRLEGLLTRLRLMQERGASTRLVLLSAVLGNYESLRQWLSADEGAMAIDTWRPTARRIAFWSRHQGRLTWVFGDDPLRPAGTEPGSSLGADVLPWPNEAFYPPHHFGAVRAQTPAADENVSHLVQYALERLGAPILCTCSTKARTRGLAARIARELPELSPRPPGISRLLDLIAAQYPYLRSLGTALTHGVAYHNSSVPHDVRAALEAAIADYEIRVTAATTTLAEGVDLPFRVTILADWLTWTRDGQRPMSSLLFRNIAGRCGRAGTYTEGDTIVFDNPVGPPEFTFSPARVGYQRNVFLREEPEELQSVVELISGESNSDLYAALASQFVAAIPENPDVEDLVETFAAQMYAQTRPGGGEKAVALLSQIRSELLDEAQAAPLATSDSPLRLTPLGRAANLTQFSPQSVRRLLVFLNDRDGSWEISAVAADAMRFLGDLPEQVNGDLKAQVTKPKRGFPVHPDEYEPLVASWLAGETLQAIFSSMGLVQRSSREPPVNVWLAGTDEPSTWDELFDKFVEFTESSLVGFLPWLFRAFGQLMPFATSEGAVFTDWHGFATALESRAGDLTQADPLN